MRKLLVIIGSTMLLTGCSRLSQIQTITLMSKDGDSTVSVQVEIADTPEARRLGLMNRTDLPENEGMLFAFEKPEIMKFWMESTLIPLDIMYFDEAGVFINAYTMTPCVDEDPCPTYDSAVPGRFALEVPEGFRESHKIGVGWRLSEKEMQRIIDFE